MYSVLHILRLCVLSFLIITIVERECKYMEPCHDPGPSTSGKRLRVHSNKLEQQQDSTIHDISCPKKPKTARQPNVRENAENEKIIIYSTQNIGLYRTLQRNARENIEHDSDILLNLLNLIQIYRNVHRSPKLQRNAPENTENERRIICTNHNIDPYQKHQRNAP